MLPDAPKLAAAWKAWYRHCRLLRRIRFIRELIQEKRHYEIDECLENYQDDGNQVEQTDLGPIGSGENLQDNVQTQPGISGSQDYLDDDYPGAGLTSQERDEYAEIQRRIKYYSNVFGKDFDHIAYETNDVANPRKFENSLMGQLLAYGPEQTSVYAREVARGAATCCPNGCREQKIREQMNLRDLEELEVELEEKVKATFDNLMRIQENNVIRDESDHHAQTEKEQKTFEDNDVEMQLFSRTPTKFSANTGTGDGATVSLNSYLLFYVMSVSMAISTF